METPKNKNSTPVKTPDPGIDRVYRYLMYGLSLPERTVRSTAAMVSGTLHESASLLIPQAFRNSKTYQTFVQQMLEVVSKDVGGVNATSSDSKLCREPADNAKAVSEQSPEVENYVARKAVSSFIDLAGMATLHVSPMTVLAIVSDVAYGTQTYLDELAIELKREGVIAEDSSIANSADLLEAIAAASADTADAFDTPPLSISGLRETIEQTREGVARIDPAKLIPQSEIARMWADMQAIAEKEKVSVFEVSSAVTMYALDKVNTVTKGALTTIRVTGELLDQHIFEHYWQGLREMGQRGIYEIVAESSQPYIEAVWYNFSSEAPTITEELVSGRMAGRVWSGFCDWWSGEEEQGKVQD